LRGYGEATWWVSCRSLPHLLGLSIRRAAAFYITSLTTSIGLQPTPSTYPDKARTFVRLKSVLADRDMKHDKSHQLGQRHQHRTSISCPEVMIVRRNLRENCRDQSHLRVSSVFCFSCLGSPYSKSCSPAGMVVSRRLQQRQQLPRLRRRGNHDPRGRSGRNSSLE
jgi:hypothetical protein